jgi:hypothetical protein
VNAKRWSKQSFKLILSGSTPDAYAIYVPLTEYGIRACLRSKFLPVRIWGGAPIHVTLAKWPDSAVTGLHKWRDTTTSHHSARWQRSDAHACKALPCWCKSSPSVQFRNVGHWLTTCLGSKPKKVRFLPFRPFRHHSSIGQSRRSIIVTSTFDPWWCYQYAGSHGAR